MLVCWSGGCDSTLVLYDLIYEHGYSKREGKDIFPIRALSINSEDIVNSVGARPNRDKIYDWFVEHMNAFQRNEITITADPTLRHFGFNGRGNCQTLFWLSIAVQCLDKDEDLYMGWIRTDDTWHDIRAVQDAFAALQLLGDRIGHLIMPLEYKDKREIISRLKEIGLYDLTRYCEESETPCGTCKPCQTHATALWQLKNFDSPLKIREWLNGRRDLSSDDNGRNKESERVQSPSHISTESTTESL